MSCLAEKGVNTIGESSFHSELINYNNVKQKSVLMFTTKWKMFLPIGFEVASLSIQLLDQKLP